MTTTMIRPPIPPPALPPGIGMGIAAATAQAAEAAQPPTLAATVFDLVETGVPFPLHGQSLLGHGRDSDRADTVRK